MAKPEIGRQVFDKAKNRSPMSNERTNHDCDRAKKQDVNIQSLELRVAPLAPFQGVRGADRLEMKSRNAFSASSGRARR